MYTAIDGYLEVAQMCDPKEITRSHSNHSLILINNHHIYVEIHGPTDGKPVVLLHHGLGSTKSWDAQVPALVAAGFRVLLYDRWGYGQSEERPSLAIPSFSDDLADLNAILSAFQATPVTLVGQSGGGTMAIYWAAQNPRSTAGLVTVAAHIYLEPKMEPEIQKMRAAFEENPRFQRGLRKVHGENYKSVFLNWFDGWHTPEARDWDMRPLLSQISCPTLVIQGDEDEHATPQHARDIADGIPNAKLWLAPHANHELPQEQPETFNTKLLEFLSVSWPIIE